MKPTSNLSLPSVTVRPGEEMTAFRLAAILEYSCDAIYDTDINGLIFAWNKSAERIFGYPAAEIMGTSFARLIPADRRAEEQFLLEKIKLGENVEHFETVRQSKEGRRVDVSLTISPIRDGCGRVIGAARIARDITLQKEHEREVARLNRLYAALSHVNQAIARLSTRTELFEKVCQVLVAHGGFHMAWIGWHNRDTNEITPQAVAGDEAGYIRGLTIYADERPDGSGPTGLAFRSGRPYVCNEILDDPVTLPWRRDLAASGLHSLAAFPVQVNHEVCGTLNVYSDEPGFFRDKEIALLAEAARDVAQALETLAEKEARQQVEQMARDERVFSATMIESMPGILYFYDEQGRFLRWNRNFEMVSGYSGAEIARMHPLDFFGAPEKAIVEQRVLEVFTKGESYAEASFLAKDGRATPYFFTGRRVMFNGSPCLVGVGVDISGRKQAEQALRESEEKFSKAFRASPDVMSIVDLAADRYVEVNEAHERVYGFQRADSLGRTPAELGLLVDPAQRREVLAQLQATGSVRDWEIQCRSRRGEILTMSHSADLVELGGRTCILGVSYDVTQQKRTAEALQKHADLLEAETAERKEAELRLASIINSTEDMVWSIDAHSLRLLVFNEALAANLKQRWGVTIKRGMAPEDKLPAAVARKWRGYYEQTIRDGAFQIEYALEDLGKLFEMTFHAIRHAGAVVGISVFAKDITKRKRAEMALRVLNQTLELEVAGRTKELQAALVRAEAADRIKSAFLATMSHELRTPLNSIIGFTGIVLQGLAGPLNAEQTKQLGMVRSSSRHLLELINDVLDLSKIEAGQMEIRAQPFDLRESLDRVIASVRPQAAKKGLALSIVAPPDLGQLNSDQRRLEQLLLNLVNNGIKFTESGSVTLTAEIIAPPVAASPASSDIVLRITDTGVGIKPEDLPLLFQPFRQIDTGTARQHEGTGLGLAICRRIAALLGGEIRVASAWGQGSEFIVTLPRHETIATHETHHSANRG